MSDFRSDPMPTSEGQGIARTAWLAYKDAFAKVAGPAAGTIAANQVADLLGFWLLWHLYGGFEGLRELGMSRASIFRKVAAFRRAFNAHPDEFNLEGVEINLGRFVEAYGPKS